MFLAGWNVCLSTCSLLLLQAFKCTVCCFLGSCHGTFFLLQVYTCSMALWSRSHSPSSESLQLPWQDFCSFQPQRLKPVQQHPERAQPMYFTVFLLAVSWSTLFCCFFLKALERGVLLLTLPTYAVRCQVHHSRLIRGRQLSSFTSGKAAAKKKKIFARRTWTLTMRLFFLLVHFLVLSRSLESSQVT